MDWNLIEQFNFQVRTVQKGHHQSLHPGVHWLRLVAHPWTREPSICVCQWSQYGRSPPISYLCLKQLKWWCWKEKGATTSLKYGLERCFCCPLWHWSEQKSELRPVYSYAVLYVALLGYAQHGLRVCHRHQSVETAPPFNPNTYTRIAESNPKGFLVGWMVGFC